MAIEPTRAQETPEVGRRAYQAPELVHYGDLTEMTQILDIEQGSKPE